MPCWRWGKLMMSHPAGVAPCTSCCRLKGAALHSRCNPLLTACLCLICKQSAALALGMFGIRCPSHPASTGAPNLPTLLTIPSGWEHLPQQAQQEVYEEAVMAVFEEEWERLEARLQRALEAV